MTIVVVTGVVVGALAIILTYFGNPANMGFCIACFLRDIAGSLGLHRAGVVQYIRPEIIGLGLGAFILAFLKREYKVQAGANPVMRFVLGFLMMVGALVFLGCPLRMVLRMSAGDLNAFIGFAGFVAGVLLGVVALKSGYNPGRATAQPASAGFIYPAFLVALLVALALQPQFIFFSESGPGSMAAPVLLALGAGLAVGVLAQRSRLCLAAGIRDLVLVRDPHLLWGVGAIFVVALAGNIALGNFSLGFAGQPVAHSAHLWNILGMTVVGFAAVLAGGCPLRQLVLAGQGDGDGVLTVFGMIAGAAFSHNFWLAGSPAGVETPGMVAVGIALVLLSIIGFNHKFASLFSTKEG